MGWLIGAQSGLIVAHSELIVAHSMAQSGNIVALTMAHAHGS